MKLSENQSRKNIEAHVDGWQAYCAGMRLNQNPYRPFSAHWRMWRGTWTEAKEADEKGRMPGNYKALPASKYRKRHEKKHPNP
jgi:hypothetical protein